MITGELAPGTTIAGDFLVVERLAEGGMGVVYVADQLSTGKQRALKLMRASRTGSAALRRFALEAKVSGMIASEHVVDVIAAGVEQGSPWMAMELLQGEPLDVLLGRRGYLSPIEVLEVLAQVCHAMAAAHDIGLVHRDLKPANIYLAHSMSATSQHFVKILDFGVSKLLKPDIETTFAVGSPPWMAPEQTRSSAEITCAADIWALGLIAFQMLSGKYFWHSIEAEVPDLQAVLREVVMDPIPSATERAEELNGQPLPPGFDDWFARCLQRNPAKRYQHARDAWMALEGVLDKGHPLQRLSLPEGRIVARANAAASTVAAPKRVSRAVKGSPSSGRRRVGIWTAIAALFGVVGVAGALTLQRAQSPTPGASITPRQDTVPAAVTALRAAQSASVISTATPTTSRPSVQLLPTASATPTPAASASTWTKPKTALLPRATASHTSVSTPATSPSPSNPTAPTSQDKLPELL